MTVLPVGQLHAGQHTSSVRVQPADQGGWNLRVEIDGRVIAVEHFTDWHRVERRRASLELEMALGAVHTGVAIAGGAGR